MGNSRPFRRAISTAAAGTIATSVAQANGCRCPIPETVTEHVDGITVVTVLHDDGCPLITEPTP